MRGLLLQMYLTIKIMIGEKAKKVIYLGSDHAGYKMKNILKDYLVEQGYEITDLGCFSEDSCDYPDIAREVGEKVIERADSNGILFCGTGIGMSIAVNKIKGVRAVLAHNEHYAEMGKRHNNANVLAMGARELDEEMVKKIAEKFLNTEFESDQERHVRRVQKIDSI